MLIRNTKLSIISIPNGESEAHGRLLPGVNEIPKAVWDAARPHMALHLETGALEEIHLTREALEPGAEGEDAEGGVVVAKLAQKAALKLIGETVDAKLLELWHLEETEANKRPKVLEAITKRLAELTPGKPAAEVGDAGEELDEGAEG
jgi:hypothetical protein